MYLSLYMHLYIAVVSLLFFTSSSCSDAMQFVMSRCLIEYITPRLQMCSQSVSWQNDFAAVEDLTLRWHLCTV